MAQTLISYIKIRFLAHATEDPNKVVEAAQRILPTEYVDNITFKRRDLQGHHGNSITLFETKIKRKEIIKSFVEFFSLGLSEIDKAALLSEINRYVANGNLYIRLNKQTALQGRFKLGSADPIRIRMRFKERSLKNIITNCHELGILS